MFSGSIRTTRRSAVQVLALLLRRKPKQGTKSQSLVHSGFSCVVRLKILKVEGGISSYSS